MTAAVGAATQKGLPMHNPCAVIPVYNHETAVPAVVDALLAAGKPNQQFYV